MGTRGEFIATVSRFGTKTGWNGEMIKTVLLTNVKRDGKLVTDHVWFVVGKRLSGLKEGDVVKFQARVQEYVKGYRGWKEDIIIDNPPSVDLKLSFPTKVEIVDTTEKKLTN
ncbi:MAG: hypothetical protein QXW57_04695 [Candidatus Micrarchaeaceae archaeon]